MCVFFFSSLLFFFSSEIETQTIKQRMFHLINTKPLLADEVFARIKQVDEETFLSAARAIRDSSHPLFFVEASLGVRRQGIDEQKTSNARAEALTDAPKRVTVAELWNFAMKS